jgi:hypothetical protein
MINATKIKVKIKSPKGTMASGMMDSDMPKTATLKETARKLRAENLRKQASEADDNIMAARRLRAENLRKQASSSDNMMAARKLRAENLRKS